eukprot:jgi/Bigna1/68922/fgenesh1_pg.7_\
MVTAQASEITKSTKERWGLKDEKLQVVSDFDKTIANEFKLTITPLNSKFEIIYFWKKDVDSPFGRPLPSALIPIIIAEAKKVKEGEVMQKISEEKTANVPTQGVSSVPGVLCNLL